MFTTASARHRARPKSALRLAAIGSVLVLAGVSFGIATQSASAATATTSYATEGFTTGAVADASAWTKPATASGSTVDNKACLTAGTATAQTPVPGCGGTVDGAGAGALRLTTAGTYLTGGLAAAGAAPIAQGLDVGFDSYQYNGSGADGIVFYLAATDPFAPVTPKTIGAAGGSLGYSASGSTPGLVGGYLGLGLDAWGNYWTDGYQGSGCATSGNAQRASVAVRGPGTGTSGYCLLKSSAAPKLRAGSASAKVQRSAADVPVEVVINTSNTTQTSKGLVRGGTTIIAPQTVPAKSYAIFYKQIGSTTVESLQGDLPKVTTPASGTASWYDGSGYPYKLTYGWVASTGGSTDVHEVNQFSAASLSGQTPTFGSAGVPATSAVTTGETGIHTVTPTVASSGGDELGPVRVTTTFPAGLTPQVPTTNGSYSCTTSGQQVVCTYPNTDGTPAGGSLPTLELPYAATGDASTTPRTITTVVASTDAQKSATGTTDVRIAQRSTTTTLTTSSASTTSGDQVTLTAAVATQTGQSASGTVTFTDDAGRVLCADVVLDQGRASCSTSALVPGDRVVTATFNGSTNDQGSAASTPVTVAKTPSAITVAVSPASSEYGTPIVFSAGGLAKGATGTVSFVDATTGEVLCTVPAAGSDVVSCGPASEPTVGDHAVQARFTGTGVFADSATSTPAPYTVTRITSTPSTTVGGGAAGTVAHGSSTPLAVTGLPEGATGTVEFRTADDAVLCTVVLPTTSCDSDPALHVGEVLVSAVYSGDATHAPATAPSATLTVTKQAAPTMSVTVDHPTSSHGDPLALDVTGGPAADATGTVSYRLDDGTLLCTADLAQGTGCTTTAAIPAGDHTVTATYSGDADHQGGPSASRAITVAKAASSITATVAGAASASVTYGSTVTLAATLPTGADPASVVRFVDGDGKVLCTTTAAQPSCDTADDLRVGGYRITAEWAGDTDHLAAAATPVSLEVTTATVAITAAVDGDADATITYGARASLTVSGLPAGATGTITWTAVDAAGESLDLSGSTVAVGEAFAPRLRAGSYTFRAVYSGDDTYRGATAETVQLTVVPKHVTLDGSVDGAPSGSTTFGTPVTLDVSGIDADATGTVEYAIEDADGSRLVLCTVTLPATSCATAADLPVGEYAVTATYLGDGDHGPDATTTPIALTVRKAPTEVTGGGDGSGTPGTGTPGTPADAATSYGTPTTLTVSDLPDGATGTVRFVDTETGAVLCTVTLPATSCATPAGLAVGDHTVTAEYSGDDRYAPSTGDPFTVHVAKATTAVTVTATPSTTWGTATLLTVGGLPDGATGTVTLSVGSTVLCTISLAETDSCTTNAIEPGTVTVTAAYSGDASYAASTADAPTEVTATHTVVREPVRSASRTSGTATWPAVPGAAEYTVAVYSDRALTKLVRTIVVQAPTTSVAVDGLAPDAVAYYRVTTTSASGVVLSTHDAAIRTAAAAAVATPTPRPTAPAAAAPVGAAPTAPAQLAFTGSPVATGMVGLGALLLLAAGALFLAAGRARSALADAERPGPKRRS